ncbi:MAG TPA: metallophosphoesterase family protein [Pyrinomonadaceae bacterium]|jgi:3',5'-cyclic AMP phosphodiesterase CpdA|nr:metallophosphoesterase family protein [Pyrinomonadaceae bacterium]
MRKLVHLSDLHFGRVDYSLIEPIVSTIADIKPDVTVVSGDLTQRARSHQFKEARRFLDRLPSPQIIVPGNHDVPLHNVFARFLQPLDKYRRYITDDLEPFYADEEVAILGINTARSLTIKDGRINEGQVSKIRERLCPYADEVTKIIVTHHPFDLPEGHKERELVNRAEMAMEALANCGADVLLAGHLHVSHTGHSSARYKIAGHNALVVSAGTATSTRGRGEVNSFNLLRVKHPFINVERLSWQADQNRFAPSSTEHFRHTPDGWQRVPDEMAADIAYTDQAADALQNND